MTMPQTVIEELKGKGWLGTCKKCGKQISVYWHIPIGIEQFPPMELCSPCLNNHGKKNKS